MWTTIMAIYYIHFDLFDFWIREFFISTLERWESDAVIQRFVCLRQEFNCVHVLLSIDFLIYIQHTQG